MELESVSGFVAAGAAVFAVFVEAIVIIAGSIWAVNKIQITTATLTTEIAHLTAAVDRLHSDITSIHEDVSDIQGRVLVLEARRSEG